LAGLISLLLFNPLSGNRVIYVIPLTIFIFILCYVIFFCITGFDQEDRIISQAILRRLVGCQELEVKEKPWKGNRTNS
jgi:phosphotransferase system  glucose/maltose/N-acetylglucosamine-specific IIC component